MSQRCQRDRFGDSLHAVFPKTFTKVDHQRGIKRTFERKLSVANKELQVRVLADRFDGLPIGKPKTFLDNQRPQSNTRPNHRSAEVFTQIGVINFFSQSPRHKFGQLHPAVFRIELPTDRQVEVGKLKLLTIAAVHSLTVRG